MAKRPNLDHTRQKQKVHHCPDCGGLVKLFKAARGGKMRGRCTKGHEHPKRELILDRP